MNSKNAIIILFFIFFYKLLLYNEIRIFFSFLRTIDLITWDNVKFNSLHERKLRYNKQIFIELSRIFLCYFDNFFKMNNGNQ